MPRVLVTGGRGFLGRHLVRRLHEAGHEVSVLAHRPPRREPSVPARVAVGDVRDPGAVLRAVDGAELVVHLVSNFRHAGSDGEARSINVDGTVNVLRAAGQAGVRQVLHCSTIGVHGDVREVPAHEGSPFNPGDPYQSTKLEAEREVRAWSERTGIPVTVLRPMSIYGPGDRRMLKLFRMVGRGWFVRAGDGRARIQPAHVDDVVRGFLACLGEPRAFGQTFIIGGDESVSVDALAAIIADALGVRLRTVALPLAPLKLLARACEAACAPLGVEPPLHRRRLSFFQNNRVFTTAKARAVLGYRALVPLPAGIRDTARWYRDRGWL
jgi:nucleoside-diphosphate-sugar epimerase